MFLVVFGVAWFFLYLAGLVQHPGLKISFIVASFVFIFGSLLMALVISFDSNLTEGASDTMKAMVFSFGIS